MGAAGVSYSGVSNLNTYLGLGGTTLPGSPVGNNVAINVPAGLNLPGTTTIFGGSSSNDHLVGNWATNLNTIVDLYQFETGTLAVGNNVTGTVNFLSGTLQTVTVGTSMTPGSVLNAGAINAMTVGPNHLVVGDNLAGQVNVVGKLGSLAVAGGTPGSVAAGSVGTIEVYGGYGPVVGQIEENGIQRRIDAAVPNNPYPLPDPTSLPSPNGGTYVNFKYVYEGEETGLYNPQLTALVTNGVSTTLPDQYDLSLITDNDVAKFNLAGLYANGASGVRNVAVEGDLLTTISPTAQTFVGLGNNAGGVRLPLDNVAGVEIRDYAPLADIQARSIQALAFGSTTRDTINHVVTGPLDVATDATHLLVPGTAIVQADTINKASATETFRVPFADLPTQQVAFYLDDGQYNNAFDNANVIFTNQRNNGQVENGARGADTALITVALGHYVFSPTTTSSIIQSINLRGDGGSFVSTQWVAKSITSTGALGDVSINVPSGMMDVSAPSIFGNLSTYGAIVGVVETTGVRVDPITGTTSTTTTDLGRAYVATGVNGVPYVTSTSITSDAVGRPAPIFGAGITGRIFSRGNLISRVLANGGISGIIAAQGDVGANSTLLSTTNPTQVGGISTDYSADSGQIVVLGRFLGDLNLLGGLTVKGAIAVRGSMLGNTAINGLAVGTSLISGGSIGNPAQGKALAFTSNQGIISARGSVTNKYNVPAAPGYMSSNDATAPDGIDAHVIDAIFADASGNAEHGLDALANRDIIGLSTILADLAQLHVYNGRLSIRPNGK